ncbi:histidine kinase dimerization/phospho-acceptor domain-containing protein [Solidesulfovibrio sp.]|uniref:histidine kinase dimerization/phospho-acceptor domain-containing protein n=1 Tax=Solidesulfovibrio sp. TaxID=2910990 RepID=UPI002B202027|nr:histidine kinase dimerization/phospho-acceptor domain-containing protein [Solidesulfovibrio sp.]MEA5090760.1 histidine kinase dimerization/phospho-acceptor domain-containing protein [Solidesulfovibrio sp.]
MPKRSITLQFLLWTWGFFLLVLSAVFVFATGRADRAVLAEAEERAKTSLDLAGFLLSREPGLDSEQALAACVDALGPHLGFRLTYIVGGRVVADSAVRAAGVPEMEDHAGRPEVREALAGGYGQDVRTSHTLGRDMLYVARAWPGRGGVPAGVLRLALPMSALSGELSRIRGAILAVLAFVFAAGGVAAYGLARSMSRSVKEIAGVVTAIGQGHYDRRIHIVPARDFAPLASAINHLAERIGAHVREIEERRALQEATLESMAEGVAILDGAGRILAANRALREMFQKLPDPTGRTPIEAGMPLCVERALGAYDPASGPWERVGRFELASGRVVEVVVARLAGDTAGASRVATFHDVTEAVTMDRIFRDFVIDVSHNLRTPLTKVRGFAETARGMLPAAPDEEGAEPGPARALDAVIRAADDMKALIEELLAAARERFAAARAAAPGGDALSALKQALLLSAPLLRAKGVTARLVGAPEGPCAVRTDYDDMVRAFCAILSQTPDAVSLGVTVATGDGHAELRFEGPANLDIALPLAELADGGGEAFLDGATRVVRLPLAGSRT